MWLLKITQESVNPFLHIRKKLQFNCYPKTKTKYLLLFNKLGRSQAGVSALNGKVVVVGGCDAWNCINTVEEYDPKTNTWSYLPNMTSCRRGAGVAVFKGETDCRGKVVIMQVRFRFIFVHF